MPMPMPSYGSEAITYATIIFGSFSYFVFFLENKL
jgi:hypothetical protein